MHLGRFHAVISDLATYLDGAKIVESLDEASSEIATYAISKDDDALKRYKKAIDQAIKHATITDPDLLQPFAQEVIHDLGISDLTNPELSEKVNSIISNSNYDPAGLSKQINIFSRGLAEKIDLIRQMENSLEKLEVEYERVQDEESEIGFMLPRDVVGNKLGELSREFDQLNKLSRAIAEISGDTEEYEPRVRTIASSWWQIFLDLTPEQIGIWVIAIERIVNLFKSNLEIKNLSNQLREQKMPEKITKLIEDEIDKRVKAEISKIAADIKRSKGKNKDHARMNELETQLRQGLFYLAKRLNQGMKVEVNLSIPDDPEDPQIPDGEKVDAHLLSQIEKKRAEIAKLTELRNRALAISEQTKDIGENAPLLIESDEETNDSNT